MANLQHMLGAMLASRMAGRGARGGALGSAAMLGGGGRRGPASGLGGKLGLAALGYLAYRAYQDVQKDRERKSGAPKEQGRGGAGPLGGLLDSLTGGGQSGTKGGSLSERIGDMLNPRQDEPAPEETIPQETISDNKALLLIRAMIAAANSDGQISPQERATILAKLDEAGADADDRKIIEKELQNPRPLDELLREVHDPETAQQFYLASRAAVGGTNEVQTSYLSYLRQRLKLPDDAVAEVEKLAS